MVQTFMPIGRVNLLIMSIYDNFLALMYLNIATVFCSATEIHKMKMM